MRHQSNYPTKIVYSNERNDCTVQAIANCTPLTYEESHALLKSAGRRTGNGFPFILWMDKEGFNSIPGIQFKRTFDWLNWRSNEYMTSGPSNTRNFTLGQFMQSQPQGNYIVIIRGHAFAVVDGVIHDYKRRSSRARIWEIYKAESE